MDGAWCRRWTLDKHGSCLHRLGTTDQRHARTAPLDSCTSNRRPLCRGYLMYTSSDAVTGISVLLRPTAQSVAACNTARRELFLTRRPFVGLSRLEYLKGDIKCLERLQRLAIRMVAEFKGLKQEQRLHRRSPPQLKVRRPACCLLHWQTGFSRLFFHKPFIPEAIYVPKA